MTTKLIKEGDHYTWIDDYLEFKKGTVVKVIRLDIEEEDPLIVFNDRQIERYFFISRFKKSTKAEIVAAKLLGNYYE